MQKGNALGYEMTPECSVEVLGRAALALAREDYCQAVGSCFFWEASQVSNNQPVYKDYCSVGNFNTEFLQVPWDPRHALRELGRARLWGKA